jgi:hypothetical protein
MKECIMTNYGTKTVSIYILDSETGEVSEKIFKRK